MLFSLKKFKLDLSLKKLPAKKQWAGFFKVLSYKEKTAFFAFSFIAVVSLCLLSYSFLSDRTQSQPKQGGAFREGVAEQQPRFINPIYLSDRDIDRDLVELIFSGLFKYDQDSNIVPDLVSSYEISNDGKTIDLYLKEAFWHDEKPLRAADVVFTINVIQDPQYQSPLRIKWLGITAEEIDNNGARIKTPQKYGGILEILTLKIIPKHIFKDAPAQNLPWSFVSPEYLVGSGPFKFEKLSQDVSSGYVKEVSLKRNKNYYGKEPFLDEIVFVFYKNTEDLFQAVKNKEIQGFSSSDIKNISDKGNESGISLYEIGIARYFALFFNQTNKNLDKDLKKAMALLVDKERIIKEVFSDKAKEENSPILPGFFGFQEPKTLFAFDPQAAGKILDQAGYSLNSETGFREKKAQASKPFTFKNNLTFRNKNQDVAKLQECLANFPDIYPNGTVNGYFGEETKLAVIKLQEKYSQEILAPSGLTQGNGEVKAATRKKLNEICFTDASPVIALEITITTSDKPPLSQIADILQETWQAAGIKTNINKAPLSELQTDVLAKRNFDILLFGEALGAIPDPFPFWHSSQKIHPGLNIPSYESTKADEFLEKARETQNAKIRQKNLEQFQKILLGDLPAIFLVRPNYVYFLDDSIKGFDIAKITEPAKRFSTIENWYIKTRRAWK